MWNKIVASSLIATIGLNAFAWLPQAIAAESPRISRLTYNFSFDIPNHGAIDLYHNAYSGRDRVSNSLYALRNTAVEDLLNTRRGIKVLLGGTEHLHKITGNKSLSFEVPGSVVDLYLLGRLGTRASTGYDKNSAGGSSASSSSHGIDTDTAPEIADTVHWLSGTEPRYDAALRARLLMGLMYVSAQLTKFDQQLKFLQKDFFDASEISAEFEKTEVAPVERMQIQLANSQGTLYTGSDATRDFVKKDWLTRHGMDDVLSILAGHREYLLDRYHLLGIEIDGKPLYQLIYQAMQRKLGFPAADLVQAPVKSSLPKGKAQIPMPTRFEDSIESAFAPMLKPTYQNQMLAELGLAVNPRIDQALIQSLQTNTERLATLTERIDYDGSRSSPLLELARYEDLWATATQKYRYLSGTIDFEGAHQELRGYFDRRDKTSRRVRYAAYGTGIGIGVAAIILSGGIVGEAGAAGAGSAEAAATWLGLPLRTWLIGSGLLTSTQATFDYVDSSAAAKVAQGLFLGTSHVGSHQDMRNAVEMKKEDFQMLLGSLIMLGAEARVLSVLSKARPILQSGGRVIVRLTAEEMSYLRGAVGALAERAEALAPMGRALLAAARSLLGMAVGTDSVMALEEAIPQLARQMRLAPSVIRARLEANAAVGTLIKGARLRNEIAKIMGRPSFFRTLLEQEAVSMGVSIVTESAARGKHILTDQFGDFLNDAAQGALVTFALVYIGAPAVDSARMAESNAAREAIGLPAPRVHASGGGFFQENAFGKLLQQSGQNFLVGLAINGSTTSVSQLIQYAGSSGDPGAPTALQRVKQTGKNALYGGLFMGISNSMRYAAYCWLQNNISRLIASEPTAKIILTGASAGNILFGGWSYVKLGQAVGVLKSGDSGPQPADGSDVGAPLDPSITGLQIQDLGGAYLQVQADDTAASYMFDFLRGGEKAGPAPVIQ